MTKTEIGNLHKEDQNTVYIRRKSYKIVEVRQWRKRGATALK